MRQENVSVLRADECCGCTACYASCPVKAIEMRPDFEDYATKYNWCLHKNPTGMPDDARRTFYEDVHSMPFDKMA